MKKKAICLLLPLVAITCSAQEALFGGTQIESPVINADGSVTINVFAPKAVKVEVSGDFLPMT
ncbi:MAG: esterase, partial [Prevotella sp.]|nr:esterase [Prevotella sp.]